MIFIMNPLCELQGGRVGEQLTFGEARGVEASQSQGGIL